MGDDRAMQGTHKPLQIAFLVYPGVQSLDFTGPLEVFSAAQQLIERTNRRHRGYELRILSPDGLSLQTSSGIAVTPHGSIQEGVGDIDTLIVAGGHGSRAACSDRALLAWIAATSARARRTASVCTGAFLLSAAGLLDGARATTHWAYARELQRSNPDVEVDPEPIFVRHGSIWTSAGVTAGMDLALALVEEDLDREAALAIARHLVLFLRRPGSQAQFSATLVAQEPQREPLREIQRSVLEHVAGDHRVEAMAERAHMSPRNFARAFRAQTGVTPARYVERVRLEAARRMLEDSSEPIAAVAAACGFATTETMRRVFIRSLRVSPAEYRRRFTAPNHIAQAS
jgi:transcriptional regulator GlxA family with amidase domain